MTRDFDLLHDISEGKHLYQFYKGESDYFEALIPFYRAGLEKGDMCFWLVSDDIGTKRVREEALREISDFSRYEKEGQIQICSANEWYLKEGHFDEAQTIKNLEHGIELMLEKGYKRLRGSGDVKAIPIAERHLLCAYEKKADILIKSMPVIGLCVYPILDCTLQETKNVIDSHDDVLAGNL